MNAILDYILSQPVWLLGAAGGLLGAIIVVVLTGLLRRRSFRRRVERFLATPGKTSASQFFSDSELLRRSRFLERLIEREGAHVAEQLGMDRLWTERLYEKERPADFRRVLRFGSTRGLFACFLVALQSRRLARSLKEYLDEHSDFLVLRRLARSGRGEAFSGEKARSFFADRLDEIREMAGDPEWPSRYFAAKILLHDQDPRSDRLLRDFFADPHPLVRRTVAEAYRGGTRESLYAMLEDLFLHDPVYEVRRAARERIQKNFSDLYSISAAELEPEEALHVVSILDPAQSDDVNAALEFLAGPSLELRLEAARFLTGAGTLRELFLGVSFSDRTEMERVRSLLQNAIAVNVTGFLDGVSGTPGPATLLIAAELLAHHGPQEHIVEVAERVFRLQEETTESYEEIYAATVSAIHERGDEQAQRMLVRELARRTGAPHLLRRTLEAVPRRHDPIYREPLLEALRNPDYPERAALRTAFLRLDEPFVLATCIDIITADRDHNPHRVRIDALLMLGELRLDYTLQDILEHLPILPVEIAREFTRTLAEYQPSELERKVGLLLDGVDGNIRAAVIAALPATGKRTFLQKIKAALDDADPDVRIAATWALVDYEETRAVNQAAAMLRDPVERVRESVARALAVGGGKSALTSLRDTLHDENEVEVVKHAAIEGLSACTMPEAVDILVEVIAPESPLADPARTALAAKEDTASIRRLVEHFKDADPPLREEITGVFAAMGEHGEDAIRAVLREEIASLRPYLATILETTGYVESRIRLLGHRDPRIRRDAADFLARVGSEAAFRGIVMAARDPDSDVRVQVTKALERLATEDGKEILHALENDPDRRSRKYTHWALERLRAKAL